MTDPAFLACTPLVTERCAVTTRVSCFHLWGDLILSRYGPELGSEQCSMKWQWCQYKYAWCDSSY